MTIPRDKLLPVALGLLAGGCALVGVLVLSHRGFGALLAYTTTTATGIVYEAQQWYRKEGAVELLDAVATAMPGWAAWGVIELLHLAWRLNEV